MERSGIRASIEGMKAERDEIRRLLAHNIRRRAELSRRRLSPRGSAAPGWKLAERFLVRCRLETMAMIDKINLLNANIQGLEEALILTEKEVAT